MPITHHLIPTIINSSSALHLCHFKAKGIFFSPISISVYNSERALFHISTVPLSCLHPVDVKIPPGIAQMLFVRMVCSNQGPDKVPTLHLAGTFLRCHRCYCSAGQRKPDIKEDILCDSTDTFKNRGRESLGTEVTVLVSSVVAGAGSD